ncbi:MAG: SDR family NAD(P)-dependent oxidoreductase [Chloroflexi bacterium]|nr:SDR family NAD(P)-dependent oxidoreductase [Chloroflexota bacterium]
MMSKVVLVTGASSGIGREIAKTLAAAGHQVFGTSRQPSSDSLDGFALLPLDVTSAQSIERCVAALLARAGRLDVLVNNAGVELMGAAEETSMDDVRWIMETNFFGVVQLTQAVLPHMRAQGSGQIINITSALGRLAWPYEAFYCASKFALEGYSESLYYECSLFNIRINTVQPGFFRTNIAAAKRTPSQPLAAYDSTRDKAFRAFDWMLEHGGDPAVVGRHVRRLVERPAATLRHPVGWEAVLATRASLAPLVVIPGSKIGRWYFGIDNWRKDLLRAAAVTLAGALALWGLARSKR